MRLALLMGFFFAVTSQLCKASEIKIEAEQLLIEYADSASFDEKIQLMLMSENTFVDPPPNEEFFRGTASLVLSISILLVFEEFQQFLRILSQAELHEKNVSGYPRLMISIPLNDRSPMNILYDRKLGIMKYKDNWYVVDAKLIDLQINLMTDKAFEIVRKNK